MDEQIIAEIKAFVVPNSTDSYEELEQLMEKVSQLKEPADAIPYLFELLERNPEADFGSPGPLVHFLERFFRRGYEEHLLLSLRRFPTPMTVWMLNRVVNGTRGEEQAKLRAELERVAKIDAPAGDAARMFLR